eukprot:1903858-Rhodomonas_salina.1
MLRREKKEAVLCTRKERKAGSGEWYITAGSGEWYITHKKESNRTHCVTQPEERRYTAHSTQHTAHSTQHPRMCRINTRREQHGTLSPKNNTNTFHKTTLPQNSTIVFHRTTSSHSTEQHHHIRGTCWQVRVEHVVAHGRQRRNLQKQKRRGSAKRRCRTGDAACSSEEEPS